MFLVDGIECLAMFSLRFLISHGFSSTSYLILSSSRVSPKSNQTFIQEKRCLLLSAWHFRRRPKLCFPIRIRCDCTERRLKGEL